jgi:superfamily I DNA/RNA helicase
MRTLRNITPTGEQLKILSRTAPGAEIIRGAAGSGKTTTALLRLKSLIGFFTSRRKRENDSSPVRILVLTFNRTLRGYIEELTRVQATSFLGVDLEIETFARWSSRTLGSPKVLTDNGQSTIQSLGASLPLPQKFVADEVDYVLGKFLPEDLDKYLTVQRDGRGASPRMERPLRRTLLETVIRPYISWKESHGKLDWNDLAVMLTKGKVSNPYDIIIVDESQDFSANQLRAIVNQVKSVHSLTFVLDSAQRIYARGFTWKEAGLTIRPEQTRRLTRNYRNTIEIARLAASLINGVPLDDDGTMPDFNACTEHGPKPIVLRGKFGKQVEYVVNYLREKVDLSSESVAILHPLGWFNEIRQRLVAAGLPYVELTRKSDWPQGSENIALSTLHSAKGLEFDHVVIIGLNAQVMTHGEEEDDDQLLTLRKLLAMGIGRARLSVILGYKPGEESHLIDYLEEDTFEAVEV